MKPLAIGDDLLASKWLACSKVSCVLSAMNNLITNVARPSTTAPGQQIAQLPSTLDVAGRAQSCESIVPTRTLELTFTICHAIINS